MYRYNYFIAISYALYIDDWNYVFISSDVKFHLMNRI